MPRLACIALLALLLGLAGCSSTVFQSLPTGSTTDCDPAWPGRWEPVASANDDMKPQGAVEIAADCRSATIKGERKPIRLTLIDTGNARYLQVHNDSGKPDCVGPGNTRCGATLLRYENDGDTMRLYDADHAWIAAAIKGKKIDGTSTRPDTKGLKTSEPTYNNFIAGDAKAIAKLLRKHPQLFTREPLLVLRRVAADAAPTESMPPASGEK
ncbi:MAG: hypothetical protein RR969_03755 [Thermomonas sp.]